MLLAEHVDQYRLDPLAEMITPVVRPGRPSSVARAHRGIRAKIPQLRTSSSVIKTHAMQHLAIGQELEL